MPSSVTSTKLHFLGWKPTGAALRLLDIARKHPAVLVAG
jgi:hypothetical protein